MGSATLNILNKVTVLSPSSAQVSWKSGAWTNTGLQVFFFFEFSGKQIFQKIKTIFQVVYSPVAARCQLSSLFFFCKSFKHFNSFPLQRSYSFQLRIFWSFPRFCTKIESPTKFQLQIFKWHNFSSDTNFQATQIKVDKTPPVVEFFVEIFKWNKS